MEMVTRGGRVFPAYERANAIKDQDGDVIGLVGVISDITARKSFEEEIRRLNAELKRDLHEIEESYRGLFDHMINGFAYCRMRFEEGRPADWIYLKVNRAFEELTRLV